MNLEKEIERANKWIEFKEIPIKPPRITQRWAILSKKDGYYIGVIKWYPAWRHYCFFPDTDTVYSDGCLLSIGNFVNKLNVEHKKKAKK